MSSSTVPRLLPYDEWLSDPTLRPSSPTNSIQHYETFFYSTTDSTRESSPAHLEAVLQMLESLANTLEASNMSTFLSSRRGSSLAGPPATRTPYSNLRIYRHYIWREASQDAYLTQTRDMAVTFAQQNLGIGNAVANNDTPAVESASPIERTVTEEETTDMCVICQLQPESGDIVTVLPCVGHAGHWFHTECIVAWFATAGKQDCPYRCAQRAAL